VTDDGLARASREDPLAQTAVTETVAISHTTGIIRGAGALGCLKQQ